MSFNSVSMTKLKNDVQILQAENKKLKSGTDIRRDKIKYLEDTRDKLEHQISQTKTKIEELKSSIEKHNAKYSEN